MRNRTEFETGRVAHIVYLLDRVDYDHHPYEIPQGVWTKDGKSPLRTGIEQSISYNTVNSVLAARMSTRITSADSGVYQCILFDTDRSEIFATHPIRVDTGENFILIIVVILC